MSNANAEAPILVVCPNGQSVYIANPSYILNCKHPAWEKMHALRDALKGLKDREMARVEAYSDECKFGRRLDGTEYYVYPGIGVPQQVPPQDWGGWRRWKIDLESAMRSLRPALEAEYREYAQRAIGKQDLYDADVVTCLMSTPLSFTRDVAEAMPMEDRVSQLRTLPAHKPGPAANDASEEDGRKPLVGLQVDVWNLLRSTVERDRDGMPKKCLQAKEIADLLTGDGISKQDNKRISKVICTMRRNGWPIKNRRSAGYYAANESGAN